MAIGQFMPMVVGVRSPAEITFTSANYSVITGYSPLNLPPYGTLVSSTLPPHIVLHTLAATSSSGTFSFAGDVRSILQNCTFTVIGPTSTLVIPPQTWNFITDRSQINPPLVRGTHLLAGSNTTLVIEGL